MKTEELTGAELDYWVARALGRQPEWIVKWKGEWICVLDGVSFEPHKDYSVAISLFESENISFERVKDGWRAKKGSPHIVMMREDNSGNWVEVGPSISAESLQRAGLLCIVASKFGAGVPNQE